MGPQPTAFSATNTSQSQSRVIIKLDNTASPGQESVAANNNPRPNITVSNFNHGKSLSVVGKIAEQPVDFLVDTGSMTLLSTTEFYREYE